MLLQPTIFNHSGIIAAQSTRLGGVSPRPFDSLNLGLSVNDDPQNVQRNRELFFGELNIDLSQLSKVHQVHGDKVLLVNGPGNHEGYDAQITNRKNVFLAASIADCTPVLIHDEKNGAVAAIHAGWRGTAAQIVSKTLAQMNAHYGTVGGDCKAFIGACIGYAHFEVGEEVAAHFDAPLKRFDGGRQKWFVDLKGANAAQLKAFGIPAENIEITERCTVNDNALFFSHRKEQGKTGRMMAVIGLYE